MDENDDVCGLIDDTEEVHGAAYYQGKCLNVIFRDEETGEDLTCDNPCNPSEQICKSCRLGY